MKKIIIFCVIIISSLTTKLNAQDVVEIRRFIRLDMDSVSKVDFKKSLNKLFYGLEQGRVEKGLLTNKNKTLTISQLERLMRYESIKDESSKLKKDKQLVNLYPISNKDYLISIAYLKQEEVVLPKLYFFLNLIATKKNNHFTFSIPLDYSTRYYKTKTIGNVTYFFRDKINIHRATVFNEKNNLISRKLGLKPEKFRVFMCDNYQEIFKLLGYDYLMSINGNYRDGYGVVDNTIFSVMNNEDFSHDIFHYYSGKKHEQKNRNWVTEEGVAYLWGNAYYTDKNGEMISYTRLVNELKKYLKNNPKANCFKLFKTDAKIFSHISPEISVRSTISAIIVKEVERKRGIKGILQLINCGSKDRVKNYLKATNNLIGLNESNFDKKLKSLISKN